MVDTGRSGLDVSGSRPSSVRAAIRGDRVGMATKAALEPSQLESHITNLMRASFGRLKVQHLPAAVIEAFCDPTYVDGSFVCVVWILVS